MALEARDNAVGNHTFHHVQLTALSLVDAGHEIANTANAITAITHQPVRLLRPPLGRATPASTRSRAPRACSRCTGTSTSDDIEGADAEKVLAAINHHAKPGSIILMHENAPQTLSSLGAIVAAVRAKHLRPVTVPAAHGPRPAQRPAAAAGPRGCGLPDPQATG